ncbi:uncharacterized protein LOC142333611 [Lycorma delicatula]|uniref:uncharacterized protein LOC142333611 n=1 Tax=Lycorma delicatula TaxID=130591 RepID=UPI003F50DF4D
MIDSNTIKKPYYFIPHHCVIKNDSTTTKLRVVFDASCKTENKLSLNDCLMNGPVVQEDLFSIVARFRKHLYAMTADVEKMYRQILLHPDQICYQLIFWRENSNKPIKTYRLLTLTYGMTSSPYLATRSLKQLAIDNLNSFEHTAPVVLTDFYVDDVLTEADTVEDAKDLQKQLTELLQTAGFNLRKWCANQREVLEDKCSEDRETQQSYNLEKDESTVKSLDIENWRHVRSQDNPADLALCGVGTHILVKSSSWWNGPEWLFQESTWESYHNIHFYPDNELTEQKQKINVFLTTGKQEKSQLLLNKYSDILKLKRVTAYMLRFCCNSRKISHNNRIIGPLTDQELNTTETKILKIVQHEHFADEYQSLKNKNNVSNYSKLILLFPFLDENHIIKVGDRLHNSDIIFDQKHPILLPENPESQN